MNGSVLGMARSPRLTTRAGTRTHSAKAPQTGPISAGGKGPRADGGRRRAGSGTGMAGEPSRRHPRDDLSAGVESKLAADLLDVTLRRALRDEQPGGDLPVRQPLSDEDCNLSLAASETRCHHESCEGA